jgi:hypothetical protein
VRFWAEDTDLDQQEVDAEPSCSEKRALSSEATEDDYYCCREATPIGDYAVVAEGAPTAAPVKNVRVYFSGQRGGAPRRRRPSRCVWRCRWARTRC